MNNNRQKGHNLERQVVTNLKVFYPYAKTSRASSRLLDNCKIDINYVPFLIQCKNGYERNRPKWDEEYGLMKQEINKHFPKNHSIHTLPFILIHKMNRKPITVTIPYDLFLKMLETYHSENILQV